MGSNERIPLATIVVGASTDAVADGCIKFMDRSNPPIASVERIIIHLWSLKTGESLSLIPTLIHESFCAHHVVLCVYVLTHQLLSYCGLVNTLFHLTSEPSCGLNSVILFLLLGQRCNTSSAFCSTKRKHFGQTHFLNFIPLLDGNKCKRWHCHV